MHGIGLTILIFGQEVGCRAVARAHHAKGSPIGNYHGRDNQATTRCLDGGYALQVVLMVKQCSNVIGEHNCGALHY